MKLYNLIKLRKQHHKNQQDIANFLKIHVVTYSRLESGIIPFDANQLIKLANLFDTSIDYLLGRKKIVRITTFENIDGDFKEIPTIDELFEDKFKKG